MNQDFAPFYNTTHKIINLLSSEDHAAVNKFYSKEEYSPDLFNALIEVLLELKLISKPSQKEYPDFTSVKKGEAYNLITTWTPKNSKTIGNISRYEYYLAYLEFDKNNIGNLSFKNFDVAGDPKIKSFITQLETHSNLFSYFTAISRLTSRANYVKIGKSTYPLAKPRRIAIFDLSRLEQYQDQKTKNGFQEILNKVRTERELITYEDLKSIGKEVTEELGYNLEEIKLPYFETYFRIQNVFPNFENKLIEKFNTTATTTTTTTPPPPEINDSDAEMRYFQLREEYKGISDSQIRSCFKVENITDIFFKHISSFKNEAGQMVGIFGKWGRGKTYFSKKLKDIIENSSTERSFVMIPFQAWKYQDTPAIWAYLYEVLSESYLGQNKFLRFFKRFWLNFRKQGTAIFIDFIMIGAAVIGFLLFLEKTTADNWGFLEGFVNTVNNSRYLTFFGGSVIITAIQTYWKDAHSARYLLKKYSKGITFSKHLGIQAEIEKEMVNLLKTWVPCPKNKRILLFVDDIDRCSEKKIIELIDALRVMLEHEDIIERVVILAAIDEEKLLQAIEYKYEGFYNQNNVPPILVQEYMDKLFISGIKLQQLQKDEVSEYLKHLVEIDYQDNTNQDVTDKSMAKNNSDEITQSYPKDHELDLNQDDIDEIILPKEREIIEFSPEKVVEMFENELQNYNIELTPRKIRIIYYRFHLAKNIYLGLFNNDGSMLENSMIELLRAIRIKTERTKEEIPNQLLDKIAGMVVGY